MKVIILGSGSKGNCTYIETKTKKVLIDAGLSFLQVKNRLAQKGITFNDDSLFKNDKNKITPRFDTSEFSL